MPLDPRQRLQLAQTHAEALRHAAAAANGSNRSRFGRPERTPAELSIVIRPDRPEDARALARLGGLDSAAVPPAPLLLAEVDGELRAALSLANGLAIADPFHRTAWLVSLLATRAGQLQGHPTARGLLLARVRLLGPRAPAPATPRR